MFAVTFLSSQEVLFAVMVCTKVLYSTSCSLTESFSYSLHCTCQWTWIQLITSCYNVVRIRNFSSLCKHTVYYQAAEYVIRNANSLGSNAHYQAAECD